MQPSPVPSGPQPSVAQAERTGWNWPPPLNGSRGAETPELTPFRGVLKLLDDLGGVRTAMAMFAVEGHRPAAAATPGLSPAPARVGSSPAQAQMEQSQFTGGAPSGAAGSALSSGNGSTALYALVLALAALAGGFWGRVKLVPVSWRSVTIVALNERPG